MHPFISTKLLIKIRELSYFIRLNSVVLRDLFMYIYVHLVRPSSYVFNLFNGHWMEWNFLNWVDRDIYGPLYFAMCCSTARYPQQINGQILPTKIIVLFKHIFHFSEKIVLITGYSTSMLLIIYHLNFIASPSVLIRYVNCCYSFESNKTTNNISKKLTESIRVEI